MLSCDYIATGHYARIREENGRHVVSRGLDATKDQSYVLWGVGQDCLSRTLFPIGGFAKSRIREMAREMGLHDLANKSESYEICFIPDNDYRSFLRHRVPGLSEELEGGQFVDSSGRVLGKHRGYPFYTIGQRKGLEVAVGSALYVTQILPETNTVVLGPEEELLQTKMTVRNFNLQKTDLLTEPVEALTKIRYKDPGALSTIRQVDNYIEVVFHSQVKAIAPGQSAVFYDGDDVIGGGFIEKSLENQS